MYIWSLVLSWRYNYVYIKIPEFKTGMFKQLACSDILLKNKNQWSSSEELSAIYTQGIYKWQAINRRSFGSYNVCWNSIETSKKPIWKVPSLALPGISCTLVSNTGRVFGINFCVCFLRITGVSVLWILQHVLLNDVTTLLEREIWDPNPVSPW